MLLNLTRGRWDTCECDLIYESDNPRVLVKVNFKCNLHKIIPDSALLEIVRAHNHTFTIHYNERTATPQDRIRFAENILAKKVEKERIRNL